jgi:fructoselysine 6-kinase
MGDNAINDGAAPRGSGRRPRIASVGDNCVDVYVGDHDARFPGGNALNVAALAAAAGLSSSYFGTVGDDPDGDALIAAARTAGVDVASVTHRPGATGVTTVRLVGGEREFLSEEYGISLSFTVDSAVADLLCAYDWVHISRLARPADLLEQLGSRGIPVSRDFGTELRQHEAGAAIEASGLAVAFFSSAGRPEAEVEASQLIARGAALAVGTIGAAGAIAVEAGRLHHQPALVADPVDTLGAGDAFIAGFIGARLQGADLEQTMRSAAEAAAETCARLGAWGALEASEVSQ